MSFIKNLELVPGCRILVSKRNMIIPHIEDNLDRGFYYDTYPLQCPCCGRNTRIRKGKTNKGNTLETIYCDNPECDSQILKKYVHFVAKKAMDISGTVSYTHLDVYKRQEQLTVEIRWRVQQLPRRWSYLKNMISQLMCVRLARI